MSDNEYERFEITDYDLENEFNVNRPRRRLTKNQQIYGIWANNSDNESDDESTNSSGRRHLTKDYTAPVNFVAGGIHQVGKKEKDKSKFAEEEVFITDEEDESSAQSRLGWKHSLLGIRSPDGSSDSSLNEKTSKHTLKQKQGYDHKSRSSESKNVGAWEQHTRGIGAKLLLQMGYKPGKGLGKDLQGISQPVEAFMRKGRGAIGAYGPETPASVIGKSIKQKENEDVIEEKEFKEKLNKWKKTCDLQPDKTKRYFYKTAEEVIEKSKKTPFLLSDRISKKLGNVPVIDMTGPEKRVLSGYHALGQTKIVEEDLYELETSSNKKVLPGDFALPELMHNIQLIVDICEQDIVVLDKAERESSEKQEYLENERRNLQEIVKLERNHIETLEEALKLIECLTDNNADLSLEKAEKIFLELKQNFAAEYKEFALDDLAAGIVAPLVKSFLDSWQPLENPTGHVNIIKKWRSILDINFEVNMESRNVFDPYSLLVWAGVIPSFRACAASWNPKEYQKMVSLLDCWAPIFPTWVLDFVLEQLVLPRLSSGVREWDPLTDTIPIDMWISPWNSILSHKMEEFIYPTIREKLGAALQAWMPQDRSARAMLTPWKGAFNEAEMQIFLIQHIMPKLQLVLSELNINPIQQDLELWNQVWEWHEVIPTTLMAELLEKYFFPKWMQVLVLWLNQSPDFGEISRWFAGWKSLLSEEILREPTIQEHLRRALDMMHRATETPSMIGTSVGSLPPITNIAPQQIKGINVQMTGLPVQLEFKELVSQKCSERGIIFAPIPCRREQGKQVYRVGKLFCYIDRNVCVVGDRSLKNWSPVSLQQMLDNAITGVL